MNLKKNRVSLISGILAAVVIVVLVILLVLSNRRNAQTDLGAAASSSVLPSSSMPLGEPTQPPRQETDTVSLGQEKLVNSLVRTDAIVALTEEAKFNQIDFTNRVFSPVYHPAITLTAENGLDSGTQTSAPWTCIVTPDGDQTKTFNLSFDQNVSAQTSKIIWQVSFVPFSGGAATAAVKPGGLLLSGEFAKGSTSFTVDFSKVNTAENAFFHPSSSLPKNSITLSPIKPTVQLPSINLGILTPFGKPSTIPLRTYYVRAFPVDSSGSSIGDGGTGLPVLYGDPVPAHIVSSLPSQLSLKFSLMPAKNSGVVTYNGEFPNNFSNRSETALYNNSVKTYAVLPSGFPVDTQKLTLQVSLVDYADSTSRDWNNTPGLVFETSITAGDPVFKALSNTSPLGLNIEFSKFVPSDSLLPEKEYIRYYVRTVALTEGAQPGTASASYSETIIINYGKYQAPDIKFYPEVKIDPKIPVVEKMTYTPVQWEATNWQYHYVVTRQPTEKEVFMGILGSNNPYTPYQVGTKLDFTPQPENKSWWEEAWDAISDFFGSVADFAARLVNWVSSAYADLKSGLINIVVSALPDSMQGPLRMALTALVDYGLASVGIPPSLPNFDDLASMGTDYLATVAMQQAGIPADSIIEYGVEELSDKLQNELKDSAKAASPNPMNWDFVQLDPDDLYRPAYITIDLYNPYDEPTPAGKLSFTADKFMDLKKNGFDSTITNLYALYGSSYVCLYKPVFGMEIPSLAPGQRLTVPVILEPYIGIPFPGCPAPVTSNSFGAMYHNLDTFDFHLSTTYTLPPIGEEAKRQGHTEDAIYSYSTTGNSYSFTIDPSESYSK